jgi:hypothetical protein
VDEGLRWHGLPRGRELSLADEAKAKPLGAFQMLGPMLLPQGVEREGRSLSVLFSEMPFE